MRANVRVSCSPKNDTPEPNSMQKQGAFHSAEIEHARVLSFQGETTKCARRLDLKVTLG